MHIARTSNHLGWLICLAALAMLLLPSTLYAWDFNNEPPQPKVAVESVCKMNSDGSFSVHLVVKTGNGENGPKKDFVFEATDLQTGTVATFNVPIGTPWGEVYTINTNRLSLGSGSVKFRVTWAYNKSVENLTADYSGKDCTPPPPPDACPGIPGVQPPGTNCNPKPPVLKPRVTKCLVSASLPARTNDKPYVINVRYGFRGINFGPNQRVRVQATVTNIDGLARIGKNQQGNNTRVNAGKNLRSGQLAKLRIIAVNQWPQALNKNVYYKVQVRVYGFKSNKVVKTCTIVVKTYDPPKASTASTTKQNFERVSLAGQDLVLRNTPNLALAA